MNLQSFCNLGRVAGCVRERKMDHHLDEPCLLAWKDFFSQVQLACALGSEEMRGCGTVFVKREKRQMKWVPLFGYLCWLIKAYRNSL